MTAVPPPYEYASRDSAQVSQSTSIPPFQGPSTQFEFSESTAVTLEWRVSGLKAMYDGTKGETKSKCIRSAVFGDVDNLWEVLFYPNSGAAGGENASLYLSCAPTPQEYEAGSGTGTDKWIRKGIWWFRFEIRSAVPDERTGKIAILATKDAADHTFANKTANWGWQQFGTRQLLFRHPAVMASDSFIIVCTVQAQPQPPAGYWLGMGLPVNGWVPATTVVNGKTVGSGGGLSAWTGGEGASGGVAGGTTAGGGVKRVVPRELVSGVGALLDDPLYSDVEFIIPNRYSRGQGSDGHEHRKAKGVRRIYANKKLLERCEYFRTMFRGGFRDDDGHDEDDDYEIDTDALSDSDEEDEAAEQYQGSMPRRSISPLPPRPTSRHSTRKTSVSGDRPDEPEHRDDSEEEEGEPMVVEDDAPGTSGVGVSGTEDEAGRGAIEGVPESEVGTSSSASSAGVLGGKREVGADRPKMTKEGAAAGPKKTRVVIKDAAWSTWWAVLFWLYTDSIYFAPLTSTFTHPSPLSSTPTPASRPTSISSLPQPPAHRFRSRTDWIRNWMDEHNIASSPSSTSGDPLGPRPVSAKAVYRLADKLDLQALRLRAFQHIIGDLTSQNVPAEVFSRFSSTFEEVRKVQVAYFLKHWTEIKKSDTMMQIWSQIRHGKHVGFEEVWPLIVGQLDFKPS